MSDYEVTLVNDNMREFYVRFYGPGESTFPNHSSVHVGLISTSTLRGRYMEDSRRVASGVSIQVAKHRLYEQDLSSQHR
jgi:hypothetical protein